LLATRQTRVINPLYVREDELLDVVRAKAMGCVYHAHALGQAL